MKHLLDQLDKLLEHRHRLAVVSLLATSDGLDFTTLRDALALTDGSLSSHLTALEKAQYLVAHKQFLGKKPNTHYTLTETGRLALQHHLAALEAIIRHQNLPPSKS